MADLALNPLAQVSPPLIEGAPTRAEITNTVAGVAENKTPRNWYIAISISGAMTLMLVAMLSYEVSTGVGVWGNNSPVYWGWPITNFVFWVGIGHAGTLISAILFLFRQRWRTSINRFAEAMTLFAVSTYAMVSALFWYVGLIPDLATMRDRAKTFWKKRVFGFFSLGWRGSNRHWRHYEKAYLLLAGLSTPLVLSVHSIVSFDFAVSVIPGWHTTIFPPYFVAGAVFSGFAMVVTLLIIVRWVFSLQHLITMDHFEKMNKIIVATGTIVGYAYGVEFFMAWYSGNPYEQFVFLNRAMGPYAWAYWTMISCNVLFPQLFWFKRIRRSIPIMFAISIVVNIGMWFERFVIISTSLHRDFLPSSWGYFTPTMIDVLTFAGTFGLFLTLILLFVRFVPIIAISEVKGALEGEVPAGQESKA